MQSVSISEIFSPLLSQEEPKKVCFTYDLFLNLEGNPPVNHLRCEKLTFNNPTKEFRHKLIKAGGVSNDGRQPLPRDQENENCVPVLFFCLSCCPSSDEVSVVWPWDLGDNVIDSIWLFPTGD